MWSQLFIRDHTASQYDCYVLFFTDFVNY